MDGSRFDAIARALAARANRRAAFGLASTLAAALGLAAPETAEAKCSKQKPCGPCRRCKKGTCKKRPDGKPCPGGTCRGGRCRKGGGGCTAAAAGEQGYAVTQATKTNFEGKPLRLTQTAQPFGTQGASASRVDLTLDGAPLLTIAAEGAGGAVTVTVTYGDAFRGINRASFINDGSTIRGEVDGRAIKPLPADGDPKQARFEDGKPPPDVRVDPDLAKAIQAVMGQAKQAAKTCDPSPTDGTGAAGRSNHTTQSAECLALYIPCTTGYAACIYGAAAGCVSALFGYGICLAIGLGICLLAAERCRRGIRHNAPCCPVRCGGDPENLVFGEDPGCCERGEICLDADDNRSGCCAGDTRPCHGRNCCKGDETCQPNGQCCRPGASLCGEVCCPNGSCQNGECCNFPDKPCGSTCCPSFTTCCNGQCCTGECVGNVCCKEPNRRCGTTCCGNNCCNSVCCAPGESCDPVTGACKRICNTRFGEKACPPGPGYPTCCQDTQTCCQNGLCCFAGMQCCPGSEEGCCPRGMECCTFGSTNFCATTCIR